MKIYQHLQLFISSYLITYRFSIYYSYYRLFYSYYRYSCYHYCVMNLLLK